MEDTGCVHVAFDHWGMHSAHSCISSTQGVVPSITLGDPTHATPLAFCSTSVQSFTQVFCTTGVPVFAAPPFKEISSMTQPLAEQILLNAKTNQWFVQFYISDPQFDSNTQQQHQQWMESQGLHMHSVQTLAHPADHTTGFYHVNFAGDQDARLAAYSAVFEASDGSSLHPHSYQMFEWSYSHWLLTDAGTVFAAQSGVQGPQGPQGA